MKHCLECLIYLLNRNKTQGVNGEVKSSKSMLIKTGYPNLLHGCDFDGLLMSLRNVFQTYLVGVGNLIASLDFMLRVALIPRGEINHGQGEDTVKTSLRAFKAKDTRFVADWLKSKGLHKLCSVLEGVQEPFILSLACKSVIH